LAVPDHRMAIRVVFTSVLFVANTTALVEVPVVVVVQASAFDALTLPGKNVPLVKFVVTVPHFVAAGTVVFRVVRNAVEELAVRTAHEEAICVSAWFNFTWDYSY